MRSLHSPHHSRTAEHVNTLPVLTPGQTPWDATDHHSPIEVLHHPEHTTPARLPSRVRAYMSQYLARGGSGSGSGSVFREQLDFDHDERGGDIAMKIGCRGKGRISACARAE
ncbi:hypothetical protein FIBSPDRAFT_944205 [Athelia psychrophila]|uniref:Uncharacterized protein n=1 Tax=Athelia psychrophila TaxID=1759441 RepID=A0A166VGA8_9AGAM|nr:hypothetical protein FIBSPDRAFT_944205 [Fibularhizoctonia sp. CBS 109695]